MWLIESMEICAQLHTVLAQEVDKKLVDWHNKCTGRPKDWWTNKVTLIEWIVWRWIT